MSKRWTIEDVERVQKGKTAAAVSPVIRSNDRKKVKLPRVTTGANALTKQALRVLDLKGFHCWRQNNGGVYDPTLKVFRKGSATLGISDIIGFERTSGRFLACEIKVGKDKLSKEQEDFLKAVENAGGIAIIIRSPDDIVEISRNF